MFGATRGLVLTAPIAARMKVGAPAPRAASPQVGKVSASTTAPRPTTSTAPPAAPAAPPAAPAAPRTASPAASNTPRPAPSAASQGSPTAPTPASELVALAERIVSSKTVRQPVGVVARILAMSENESRKNVIEKTLGVHHSVITRVLAEAEQERRNTLSLAS
ncbi:hypothetical protein AOT83_19175 [Mycobacteroides sp. H001]|nr:hypothetical protein AOT86_11270 [Mycobacteroides sp. H072]KRQ32595.1 hypothetical protein AOT84_20540 [Mycobacteroides sp. H002]KRQ54021.1 hypothetical protein AOT85_05040 [Mycobacteroides sp. H054]KRQ68038.1 hypothetical protein AOT83_19175 [Mycobacteroides sp. H001]